MEVRIEHLTKVFPGRKKNEPGVTAVNDMTFVIPDGKLVGLLGPSGCGKSTTLYMIAGLHKPTGGKIFFGDDEVTNLPPENRGIGLVFQNYALYPHFTVGKNIRFPLDNLRPKLAKEEKDVIVHKMARLVDIEPYLERKPKELSGGQQQRVAIARALAKTPRVLLLDEPLSNLDARLRLQTREEIKRIQRETNITTVFVTHDQEEAMSISDFIVVMKDGIIQQIGEPQHVYEEPANLFVAKFLGSPAINILEGEIKGGKLYINGQLISSDPEYKKPLVMSTFNEEVVSVEKEVIVPLDANGKPLPENHKSAKIAEEIGEYRDLMEANLADKATGTLPYYIDGEGNRIPLGEDGLALEGEAKEEALALIADYETFLLDKESLPAPTTPYIVETKVVEETKLVETTEEVFDRKVVIGVRPESFALDPKGKLKVQIDFVEHIGRDISVVGTFMDDVYAENEAKLKAREEAEVEVEVTETAEVAEQDELREYSHAKVIIPSQHRHDIKGETVSFSMKRLYVFDFNGVRIK